MRLTVVGCSGSIPGPDSPSSCYLLEHDGARILLDLGNGALGSLARFTDIHAIDAVLISHLHADHCIDLTSAYVARRYAPGPARPVLPVHGPPGTGRRIARAYAAGRGSHGAGSMARVFDFRDLDGQPLVVGPFEITTARMAHPVTCFGMRVRAGGRSVAYSADTGPTPALVELARDADVALFEASVLDGQPSPADLHLTATQAGEHAAEARVQRLVLTHLAPWNDPALTLAQGGAAFPGEAILARTGLVLDV